MFWDDNSRLIRSNTDNNSRILCETHHAATAPNDAVTVPYSVGDGGDCSTNSRAPVDRSYPGEDGDERPERRQR